MIVSMNPIAIFYHGVFFVGDPPELLPNAVPVITEQMRVLKASGLLRHTLHFHVGLNGGLETEMLAAGIFPSTARITLHGLQSRGENRTILMLEEWLKKHPERAHWNILYFHAKNATHPASDEYGNRWRNCMQYHCITQWHECIDTLEAGNDACGCHWLTEQGDGTQSLFGGNFFWAKASFLMTLPSIQERKRIHVSGIDALESRFESEVWIGNGKRLPRVRDFHAGHPSIHAVQ